MMRVDWAHGWQIMAINRAGLRVEGSVRWWATYHPEFFEMEGWLERRKELGGNTDMTIIADSDFKGIPGVVRQGPALSGSSTLFGVLAGLDLGYARVLVAGAPLDAPGYHCYRRGWISQAPALKGRVFSLSGWTKTFLEGLARA